MKHLMAVGLLLTMGLAAQQAYAQGAPYRGYGGTACKDYALSYEKEDLKKLEIAATWADGFFSGQNSISLEKTGTFQDLNAIKRPVDFLGPIYSFCKANPDRVFASGAIGYFRSLKTMKRK